MGLLRFGDVELTYASHGSGERIVLVHASAFVSWYGPLLEQLTGFSTLRYRRRLRPSDGGGYRPLTVAEDAATCVRLMDHVGWPTAHIVGHSYGALVALQLAMDAPERVGSVALLEPAARGISSSEKVAAALQPVIAAYRSGDKVGRWTASCVMCAAMTTAPRWTERCRTPSARRSAKRICSSRRRCQPCSSGGSGPTTPSASRSRC